MTADCDEHIEDPALAALTSLARRSAPSATTAQLGHGWSVVSSRLVAREARRRGLTRMMVVGTAACALALAVVGILSWSRGRSLSTTPPALAYLIEGGRVLDGGYLQELGDTGVKLLFTEGTEFALAPRARGRLHAVDSKGARIAIETGTAAFKVTPRREAKWLVDVGPFLVTVKGTTFAVSWDPGSERFELRLRQGQVLVTGPLAQEGIALGAGQRLAVNLSKKEILITELKPEGTWMGSAPAAAATTSLPKERPPAPQVADQATTGNPSVSSRGGERRRWAEALASGDWDRILADADRAGVKRTLAEASSEDLFILADAARYRRRVSLARDALLSERKRFPESARALDAAFLLGRLEESNERGTNKAIAWYEEYLRRAPAGTYAAEALGRKMMATSKVQGPSSARPLAEGYLRRFPGGTYAGAARALLHSP